MKLGIEPYLFCQQRKHKINVRIDCFDVVPVSLHLAPNILNKAAPCHTDTDYQEEVWLQCETNRGKEEKNHVKPVTVDYLFCSSYSLLLRMLEENITQKFPKQPDMPEQMLRYTFTIF